MNISEMECYGTVTFLKNNLVQEDKTTDGGQSGRTNLVMGCKSRSSHGGVPGTVDT